MLLNEDLCKVRAGTDICVMRCINLDREAKRGLYEGVTVPIVLNGQRHRGSREAERRRFYVFEIRWQIVSRIDRIRNNDL